jgi:prevent-host-death family protein
MIDVQDIHSLSDFQRNTKRYVRKLKTTGKPVILTVNGGAELVVQSAKAYQELLEDRELLDSLRRISRGLEQARRGEGRPAREFVNELARKHGISLRP